jgi:hypothetical protein
MAMQGIHKHAPFSLSNLTPWNGGAPSLELGALQPLFAESVVDVGERFL